MADMGDFFTGGSYAYGAYVPPYGTKRGKARFELMKERIVAEWEEEQRQKKAAEEGKPHDEIQEDSSKKTNDTKEKNTKTGDGKKEGFWRKTLRKMEGNW